MMNEPQEKPPILGSWKNVYALVIIVLGLTMAALYLFTKQYQ